MTVVEAPRKSNKWLWIGIGGTLLFCLCAVGVAILLLARVGQKVQEGMKTDPESAAKAAHEIADYELPPDYEERVAIDFFAYTMVMIGPDSSTFSSVGKPIILLTQFRISTNQQQMEEQMQRSLEQQSGRRGLTMKLVETKTMTIRGEEVDVLIYEGTDENGFMLRQLITTFPGKAGTTMLTIMGDLEYWDDEEINAFIESIH